MHLSETFETSDLLAAIHHTEGKYSVTKFDCQLIDSLFSMSRTQFVPFAGCVNLTLSQILSKQISYLKHHLCTAGVSQTYQLAQERRARRLTFCCFKLQKCVQIW